MTYPTQFNQCVERTLVAEGFLSDNKNDKGGLTKYGCTAAFLTEAWGRIPTKQEIIDLTREQAIDAYHKVIWLKRKVGEIKNERFQEQVFDFAVNSGGALKVVQALVRAEVDGNLGPATQASIAAYIAAHGERKATNNLLLARGRYLMDQVQLNPKNVEFVEGWYNRVVGRLDFGY